MVYCVGPPKGKLCGRCGSLPLDDLPDWEWYDLSAHLCRRFAARSSSTSIHRYYGVRVEGAKYGVGFGSALAIAISYNANHSIIWAIIHGILGWLYVIYFALFRS